MQRYRAIQFVAVSKRAAVRSFLTVGESRRRKECHFSSCWGAPEKVLKMNFFHVKRPSSAAKKGTVISPMTLPSIIVRTFSYLKVKDLLACRHVNKLWRDESTKQLQGDKGWVVRLRDLYSIDQFNKVLTTHVRISATNMFTAMEIGQRVSLEDTNYQISLSRFSPYVRQLTVKADGGPMEWRWLLFDQFCNITELHIHSRAPFQPVISAPSPEPGEHKSVVTPGQKFPHSSHFRPKELVNLTKVSFNMKNRKSEDIFVRRFVRDMLSIAPNLKSLEWIKEDAFANDFQKTMFDCLLMRTRPEEGKLEVFKCPSLICGTKELKDITCRKFPLKELHIQISPDVSAQCLETFLESLGATLQVIKLGFSAGTPLNLTVGVPISNLTYLKELSLTEYRRSIGFVGYLPSLKKLTLTRTNIKRALLSIGWSFDHKEQTELSKSLQALLVFNDFMSREQGNCTREIVLKLAHCFPNIKIIRLEGLDDSSIRHLFKSFEYLEEVYAPAGTYSDEAFRSYTNKDQLMSSSGKSPNRYSLSSFDASHLQHIRTLELESIGLTDKFITQGIINWRSLRSLSIKYSRISFPVLCRVLMEMDLLLLSLQYCTILTDAIQRVQNDPVEMLHEDEELVMTYNSIQKWRFEAFALLFEPTP